MHLCLTEGLFFRITELMVRAGLHVAETFALMQRLMHTIGNDVLLLL
jgi:hypothetical protein